MDKQDYFDYVKTGSRHYEAFVRKETEKALAAEKNKVATMMKAKN